MSEMRLKDRTGPLISVFILLASLVLGAVIIPAGVFAHAPTSVSASYDFSKQELTVSVGHSVSDNTTHYVYQMKIFRNSVLNRTVVYSDQPTNNAFSYKYSISAKDGDYLNVTASCNQGGSTSATLQVKEPKKPLSIVHSPRPAFVDEGSVTGFHLNITSTGSPVGGLTVKVLANLGTVTAPQVVSKGNFTFDLTAPAISSQTSLRINVSAEGTGYQKTYRNIDLKVNDTTPPSPGQIVVFIQPMITELDEESVQSFTILLKEGGKFITGVDLNISSDKGFVTGLRVKPDGNHSFNFTAPHVDSDTSVVLRIRAEKTGLMTGYLNYTLGIINIPEGPQPSLDGVVEPGEYSHNQVLEDDVFELHWKVTDDHLHIAMKGRTDGWVSLGFEPTVGMKDADMLFGWVSYEGIKVFDLYSTGETGPHPPDESLGGTNDIIEFGASENGGWTTVEVIRMLDTGDQYDFVIPLTGTVDVIWAIGSADGLDQPHSERDSAVWDLGSEPTDPRLVEDGVVSAEEYGNSSSFGAGKFTLHWKVDGEEIRMAMAGQTVGWVSIGFEPSTGMMDADMVFGWVSLSDPSIVDAYSTGIYGPHPPDSELGGTDDIRTYGGREIPGLTVMEFTRKLDTGDSFDKAIPRNGTLKFIWAIGFDDSFTSQHASRGSGTIELRVDENETEPPENETDPRELLDGVIESGEYTYNTSFMEGKLRAHWSLDNGTLRIALDGETTGWVAIGFEPSVGMSDADMLFGWVEDGNASVMDAYSTGINGPHPADTVLGGSDDILLFGGNETSGRTVVEIVRNLTTTDSHDFSFPTEGNVTVIWALGVEDDPMSLHSFRGGGVLSMWTGPVEPPADPRWTLDGVITAGEYSFNASFSSGDMMVLWSVKDGKLQLAMSAKATGWVSIGFKPIVAMKDADMLFGAVKVKDLLMMDAYSTGEFGPHPADTVLGGTDDLLAYGGNESNGWTTVELIRELNTSDPYDAVLSVNETVPIIWAFSSQDDLTSQHSARGSGTIKLGQSTVIDDPKPTLDGLIGASEYTNNLELDDGNYILHWSFSGNLLKMGMQARTAGWVAVGFDPTNKMKDADMVIGFVDAQGKVHIVDAFSTGETGPHPPDASLGGTHDILEFGGSEKDGWTTIEFTRNRTASDLRDRTVKDDGTTRIIWAYGPSDDLTAGHGSVRRGSSPLKVEGEKNDDDTGFPVLLVVVIAILLLLVLGIVAFILLRKGKTSDSEALPEGLAPSVSDEDAPVDGQTAEGTLEE